MGKPKFKLGDNVTLKFNPNDEAIRQGIQGYYCITGVYEDGYDIYSYNRELRTTNNDLQLWFKHARRDFQSMSEEQKKDFPIHMGRHETFLESFEESYRLMTPEEVALYAKKTVY